MSLLSLSLPHCSSPSCATFRRLKFVAITIALLLAGLVAFGAESARRPAPSGAAENIAELINPAKLATLGQRGANPRVQKITYWLRTAQQQGADPKSVAADAVARASYTNALAAQLTRDAMLRNLKIAEGYGCLDPAGMADMRRGQSPTIQRGSTYRGDQLSVDHIVPRAVCPELDNVLANLELMPMRRNSSKRDKVEARQVQKAEELHLAGLLSKTGLANVRKAAVQQN
jgi:hypothetical protein